MKNLLLTFSLILTLLAGLLGVWWYQSYERDRGHLRRHVERDLEDLLIRNVFRHAVPYFSRGGQYWEGGTPEERAQRSRAYVQYSQTMLHRSGRVIVEHYTEEMMPRQITIKANPFRADSQMLTFHFQDDGFTLESLPPQLNDSIYDRYGVHIQQLSLNEPPRSMKGTPLLVHSKLINRGPEVDPTYFAILDYKAVLLWGMLPELFFGLLLFFATGIAFATAYRNLREQENQLRLKDALVANVAHELKTPIATVGVALEALNTFGADADPARRQDYLSIGQSELRRLEVMADRAIDSLQAGDDLRQRLRRRPTDLSAAVTEAWRGLALRYNHPQDSLTLNTYGGAEAAVDAHYWHHLVYNLLDNACKYGGDPPRIEVVVAGQAGETVLTVSDNGPGIPRGERESVFERFYRIYVPGAGHEVKGHGLGLTFVRQVAEAHGGSVTIDDSPLGGARFTVRIPTNR